MSNMEEEFALIGYKASTDTRHSASNLAYTAAGKRIFDLIFALSMSILVAPILLVFVAYLQVFGGQPFFGHMRIGLNGKAFKCWKFRTMVRDGDLLLAEKLAADPEARAQWEYARKLDDDPRVTRLGKFLRRTSIDELPQLWNVIRGEMSIVGPRPIPRDELELYGSSIEDYMKLRPGLSGLWQVHGRGRVDFQTRVKIDVVYKNNLCFWNDLKIILGTVGAVIGQTGR